MILHRNHIFWCSSQFCTVSLDIFYGSIFYGSKYSALRPYDAVKTHFRDLIDCSVRIYCNLLQSVCSLRLDLVNYLITNWKPSCQPVTSILLLPTKTTSVIHSLLSNITAISVSSRPKKHGNIRTVPEFHAKKTRPTPKSIDPCGMPPHRNITWPPKLPPRSLAKLLLLQDAVPLLAAPWPSSHRAWDPMVFFLVVHIEGYKPYNYGHKML